MDADLTNPYVRARLALDADIARLRALVTSGGQPATDARRGRLNAELAELIAWSETARDLADPTRPQASAPCLRPDRSMRDDREPAAPVILWERTHP